MAHSPRGSGTFWGAPRLRLASSWCCKSAGVPHPGQKAGTVTTSPSTKRCSMSWAGSSSLLSPPPTPGAAKPPTSTAGPASAAPSLPPSMSTACPPASGAGAWSDAAGAGASAAVGVAVPAAPVAATAWGAALCKPRVAIKSQALKANKSGVHENSCPRCRLHGRSQEKLQVACTVPLRRLLLPLLALCRLRRWSCASSFCWRAARIRSRYPREWYALHRVACGGGGNMDAGAGSRDSTVLLPPLLPPTCVSGCVRLFLELVRQQHLLHRLLPAAADA